MAVGVAEAHATVNEKIPLGRGRALYIGTLALGKEYATGGDTIGLDEANSRHKLPEKLDALFVNPNGGFFGELIKPNKLKIYQVGEAAKPVVEAAAKADLSAVTAMPFIAIGIS